MKIRPRRRHQTTTNPVKSLQQRNDVRTDTEVERPRIEKKPVASEHPVIKRKKKKYKDPDNLCKMPVHDLTELHFACIFILQQINIDCGMFNSFTVEISPEHPDTE